MSSLKRNLSLAFLALFFSGCAGESMNGGSDNSTPVVDSSTDDSAGTPAGSACPGPSAKYRVVFTSTWGPGTHPVDIPSDPHFSGLIGGVHNDAVRFWEEGGLASQGIEDMAERGRKTPLDAEVQQAIDQGTAFTLLSGGNIPNSPGAVSLDLVVTPNFPLVSLVSMLAPSPDWFVGVSALSLCQDGEWVERLNIPLYVWDAGSDSGESYESPDADLDPQLPIAQIEGYPFLIDGKVPAVGSFEFVRF